MIFPVLVLLAVALPSGFDSQQPADTLFVSNLDDSGPGSLRQTIAEAPDGSVIRFGVEGIILLTSGEIVIDKPLQLEGGLRRRVEVRAEKTAFQRVFTVAAAPVTISDLTISGGALFCCNDDRGGGIKNEGVLELLRTTITGNIASYGGGLHNAQGAEVTIVNSTISGNFAADPGFGCDGGGFGGGIANSGGRVTILSSTVVNNLGPCGGGLWQSSGTIELNNTIVAAQQRNDDDCEVDGGALVSNGHNLESDGTCRLDQPTDISGANPRLSQLAHNGGSTRTHLPRADSPVIDAGDTSTAPPRDQRGVFRPSGAAADIGAVEVVLP